MKKKILILAAAMSAMILSGCTTPGGSKSSSSVEPPSSVPAPVAVESIELDQKEVTLTQIGRTVQLKATVYPENARNQNYSWSSSDINVAQVDRNGLVTAVAYGSATITVKTLEGGKTATCNVKIVEKLATVSLPDDDITKSFRVVNAEYADNVITAKAGTLVYVFPTYDTTKYELEGAIVGQTICGTADGGIYFVMPESSGARATTVQMIYNEIPAVVTKKNVVNGSADYCYIVGIAGLKAEVGASTTFNIAMKPGYELSGKVVVATVNGDKAVNVASKTANEYTFVMPNEDVKITIEAEALNFQLSVVDQVDLLNTLKVDGKVWNGAYAQFGSTVQVQCYYTSSKVDLYKPSMVAYPVGMGYADPVYIDFDDQGYAEFEMPYFSVKLYILADVRYNELNLECDYHMDVFQLTPDSDGNVDFTDPDEEGVIYGYSAYIGVYVEDPYSIRLATVEPYKYYNTYFGSTSTGTTSRANLTYAGYVNIQGYTVYVFAFKCSYRPAEAITLRFTEKNMNAQHDYELDGTYFGFSSWATASDHVFSAAYESQIDTSGDASFGGDRAQIQYFDKVYGYGVFTYDAAAEGNYYYFMEKDGLLVTSDSTQYITSMKDPYIYCYVKAADSEDEQADYDADSLTVLNGAYVLINVKHNDEPYMQAIVDVANSAIITNVSYNMLKGERLCDAGSAFEVYVGAKLFARFGYNASTKKWVPAASDAPYGYFTGVKGTLYLDGFGSGFLGEDVITYSVEGNVVSGKIPAKKLQFTCTLNTHFHDYSEYQEEALKTLVGKTFRGLGMGYYNSTGTHSKDYEVEFVITFNSETTATVRAYQETVSGNKTFTAQSRFFFYLADEASTYTFDNGVLTLTVAAATSTSTYGKRTGTWVFNVDANLTTLTLTSTARLSCYDYFIPTAPLTEVVPQ